MKILSILLLAFLVTLNTGEANISKRLDLYTKYKGPGLALLLIRDGKTIRSEGYGYYNIADKSRITPETNFNLASNSKQFTAMAALLLERAGKLSPEDLVSKYIPDFPAYAKTVKVKNLIYHTAGLPDYMELCDSKTNITNKEVIELLKKKEGLKFNPGEKHEYSNTGYVVLSEVIERASKTPFYEFIKNEIFSKLNLRHATVLTNAGNTKVPVPAVSYSEWPFLELIPASVCDTVYGDGGVMMGIQDYAKWLNALTSGDFLSQDERNKIFRSGLLNDGKEAGYAYGWMIDEYKNQRMVIHTGAWQGYRSMAAYLPAKKTWLVILSNYKSVPLWDLVKETLFK